MFAYEYAEKNFNYAYKGNYNNIFLYNDSKPKGFEVIEKNLESSELAYIPVELDDSDSDYVKVLEYEWYEDVIHYVTSSSDADRPKAYNSLIFDYLLKQGYVEETDLKKIYQPVGYANALPQEVFIYKGTYYISTLISTINDIAIDEVIVTASAYPKPVKPFLDFDDQLDKEDNQLIAMVSSNGAKTDHAFINTTEVNPNEIALFIEDNQGSNLFGSSIRVKSGSGFTDLSYNQKSIITKLLKKMDLDIDISQIIEIIKKHLVDKKNKSQVVYYIKKTLFGLYKVVSVVADVAVDLIGEAIQLLIDGVEKLKIDDKRWRYYKEDGKVNDQFTGFLPVKNAIDKLENSKDFIKTASNNVSQYLDNIEKTLREKVSGLDQSLNGYLKGFIDVVFDALSAIRKILKTVLKGIAEGAKDFLIFINALVVGLINSLLDTVLFILGIARALFNPEIQNEMVKNVIFNTKASLSMFLEVMENGIDIIGSFISKTIIGGIAKFFVEVYILITNPSKSTLNFSVPKADAVGNFVGGIVGFIVEEVLTAMLTLGTFNVLKASQLVYSGMKTALQSVRKAPKAILSKIGKVATTGVIKIINLMDVIKDFIIKLPKYLDDLVEWLKSKLLTAKAFLDDAYRTHFKESIRKQLEKLGIRPSKFDEATDTFTFCPIKSV